MKKLIWPILISFSLTCGQNIIDGIAAIVGSNAILISEIDQVTRMTATQMNLNIARDTTQYRQLQRNVLKSLIEENILLEIARIETVEVKDREVDAALNQQIQNIIAQVGSQEAAEEILGAPLSKIKKDYRPLFKNRLIVEKLRNEKFKNVAVSRKEIEAFYKTYKDSLPEIPPSVDFTSILFLVKPGPAEERIAQQIADSLRTLIINGADFATLAKENSDDVASARFGGDLGYIKRGAFIKSFEEVAFSLTPGEISPVIKTDFGYHIIQMLDRQGENINVRHILIKPLTSDENYLKTKNLADSVRNLIVTNQLPFDSAVIKFSDETNKNITKGRVKRIPKNQIQNEYFIQVINSLQVGEVSEVFASDLGFHILKLNGLYDDTWQTIERLALEHKKNQLYMNWLEKLRKDLYIEEKISL
jgi:peptidyl-prolyl cis-trans isomerase SurA